MEKYEFVRAQRTMGQDVPSRAHARIFSREIHFRQDYCIADMATFTALAKIFSTGEIFIQRTF